MPFLSNRRVLLAKIESSYGVDPVPSGAANAIRVVNLEETLLDADIVSRNIVRPYLGNSEQIIAGRKSRISFEVELQGSGTPGTAPGLGPILRACGLAEVVTAGQYVDYIPVSSGFESVTLYFQPQHSSAGVAPLHKITGARGSAEMMWNAKTIPVLKITMTGIYNGPANAANIVADYSAFKTPVAVNKANTPLFKFFGISPCMTELSVNMNNTIVHRDLPNCETVMLTDRKVSGNVVFEAPDLTVLNTWQAAVDGTAGSLEITHGTVPGRTVDFAALNSVNIQNPSYQSSDGIEMLSVPFVLVPGNTVYNEFLLRFR